VAQRKAFLLRIDPDVLEAVQRWADDDLRSLNGQIEFLLRRALADADRSDRIRSKRTAPAAAPLPPVEGGASTAGSGASEGSDDRTVPPAG
jgi:hypothetical protein